jgi:hypothetical protein
VLRFVAQGDPTCRRASARPAEASYSCSTAPAPASASTLAAPPLLPASDSPAGGGGGTPPGPSPSGGGTAPAAISVAPPVAVLTCSDGEASGEQLESESANHMPAVCSATPFVMILFVGVLGCQCWALLKAAVNGAAAVQSAAQLCKRQHW